MERESMDFLQDKLTLYNQEANNRSASQENFLPFVETKFIALFTSACHRSLFWATWIKFTPSHHPSFRSILILSSHILSRHWFMHFLSPEVSGSLVITTWQVYKLWKESKVTDSQQGVVLHLNSNCECSIWATKRPLELKRQKGIIIILNKNVWHFWILRVDGLPFLGKPVTALPVCKLEALSRWGGRGTSVNADSKQRRWIQFIYLPNRILWYDFRNTL